MDMDGWIDVSYLGQQEQRGESCKRRVRRLVSCIFLSPFVSLPFVSLSFPSLLPSSLLFLFSFSPFLFLCLCILVEEACGHLFSARDRDCGYPYAFPLKTIADPRGEGAGFYVDDSLLFETHLTFLPATAKQRRLQQQQEEKAKRKQEREKRRQQKAEEKKKQKEKAQEQLPSSSSRAAKAEEESSSDSSDEDDEDEVPYLGIENQGVSFLFAQFCSHWFFLLHFWLRSECCIVSSLFLTDVLALVVGFAFPILIHCCLFVFRRPAT